MRARLTVTRCRDAATFVVADSSASDALAMVDADIDPDVVAGFCFHFDPVVLDTRCPLLHDTYPDDIWSAEQEVIPYLDVRVTAVSRGGGGHGGGARAAPNSVRMMSRCSDAIWCNPLLCNVSAALGTWVPLLPLMASILLACAPRGRVSALRS